MGCESPLREEGLEITSCGITFIITAAAAAAAKLLQSCLTLCDPIDGRPPGSPRPWDSPGKNTGVGLPFLSPMQKSEKSK